MNKKHLKRLEIALLIGLAMALLSGTLALGTQQQLADKVIRLHVLANSDSEADQALKLQVRDVILTKATELLKESADRQEAEKRLRKELPELERLAAGQIHAAGYGYSVSAELADTHFPTKAYDDFALPAGDYLALRIIIGAGEGHNWWCVVFPPLCTTAAAEMPSAAMAAGFQQDEVRLISEENEGYILKFKTLELWEQLREKWSAP